MSRPPTCCRNQRTERRYRADDAPGPRSDGRRPPRGGRERMRAAWRTSGSARQQPQETEEPSASLLPHGWPLSPRSVIAIPKIPKMAN